MNTNNELDYYLIGISGEASAPLLVVDEEHGADNIRFLSRQVKVAPDYVAHLRFGAPIPAKPEMVDYHDLDGGRSVFSSKVYNALKSHDIKGLQLVRCIIRGKDREEIEGYRIANVYHQRYRFFDTEKSQYDDDDDVWFSIDKIVLDKNAITEVPLEDRLVFVAGENSAYVLFHKSLVDIIMSANPRGLVFVPVEEWRNGM